INVYIYSTSDDELWRLRRYPLDGESENDHRLAHKNCDITMRSGMAYLTIENAPDTMKKVAEFAGTIRSTRGENFRAVVSSNSIRVIARQEALDKFKETFRAKEIIGYSAKLAEICLLLPFG